MRVYLSGSVKKGKGDPRSPLEYWSNELEASLVGQLGPDTELLNPSKSDIQRTNYFINYGCDLYLVANSDVMLVDLRSEKGIGVGAEMMFAQYIQLPVVSWVPRNSHYRRDLVEDVFGEDLRDWIHPFAFGLSDYIAESVDDACSYINQLRTIGPIKDDSKSISNALDSFLTMYPSLQLDGSEQAKRFG